MPPKRHAAASSHVANDAYMAEFERAYAELALDYGQHAAGRCTHYLWQLKGSRVPERIEHFKCKSTAG
jgi:hypothetical protein